MRGAVRKCMTDDAKAIDESNTRIARLWRGVETIVNFERVAFVGDMGRIQRDGFMATGRRRRTNPPRKVARRIPTYI